MTRIGVRYGHGHNIHTVELTDEECNWPDAVLITMVDRHGNADEAWSAYRNREHPGHFGGVVRREGKQSAVITVYTD